MHMLRRAEFVVLVLPSLKSTFLDFSVCWIGL